MTIKIHRQTNNTSPKQKDVYIYINICICPVRTRKMACWLRASTHCSWKGPHVSPCTHIWWLTNTCNSGSWGSNTLWSLHACVHTHSAHKLTYIYKTMFLSPQDVDSGEQWQKQGPGPTGESQVRVQPGNSVRLKVREHTRATAQRPSGCWTACTGP